MLQDDEAVPVRQKKKTNAQTGKSNICRNVMLKLCQKTVISCIGIQHMQITAH